MAKRLREDDALLLIDVQRDFFSGGSAEVPHAEEIIPVLNDWIHDCRESGALLIAVRDWHTVDHASFKSEGGTWPPHCVQDTPGALFHASLRLPHDVIVVSKGTAFDDPDHSAFDNTGLESFLRKRGIRRLWVGGLNEETSVRFTVEDACELGFETHLIVDAARAFDPASADAALAALRKCGAHIERASLR